MIFELNLQHRLVAMFEKLPNETELRNEIIFFMHNCLVGENKDLTSSQTLPCAQVICKSLLQLDKIESNDKF